VLTPAEAAAACEEAGKRLCTAQEWERTCSRGGETVYVYGDEYEPVVCNSRDTFCDPACGVYPQCYRDCPFENLIMPTGSFPDCTNEFGIFDLSGNTWEAVESTDGADHFRGGAHDCGDPALAQRCDYDGVAAGTFPATRGFRCCADGEPR
jgi:formylglycine-generating enzyme required for sulfatase activity